MKSKFILCIIASLSLVICSCTNDDNVTDEYYVRYVGHCKMNQKYPSHPNFIYNGENGKTNGIDNESIDITIGPVAIGFKAVLNCTNISTTEGDAFVSIAVSKNGCPFVLKDYRNMGTHSSEAAEYTIQ